MRVCRHLRNVPTTVSFRSRSSLLPVAVAAGGVVLAALQWLPPGGLAALLAAVVVVQALLIRRAEADTARHIRAGQRLQAIADNMPARISQFDRAQRVVFANRYCGEVYGCDPASLIGKTVLEVRGPAAHAMVQPFIERVLAGEPVRHEHALSVNGELRHYQQDFTPDRAPDGSIQGFCSISFDVTERRRAEIALATSEKRLRDIADNLPVLISYIDAEQRLLFVNETVRRWIGIGPEQAVGRRLAEVLGADAMRERLPHLMRAMHGESVGFEATLGAGGTARELHVTYLPDVGADGRVAGVYALCADVTPLKQVQRRLDQLSRVDPLTGLPNRREFDEKLHGAMARCRRFGRAMAVLFLDVDNFKAVNDRLGHAAGDAVLKTMAQRLRDSVRQTDTVARLAGDEFVVILEALLGPEEAETVAQKIVDAVQAPMLVEGTPRRVSTSLGLTWYDGDGREAEVLLAQADAALYAAKSAGRNTWRRADAGPAAP